MLLLAALGRARVARASRRPSRAQRRARGFGVCLRHAGADRRGDRDLRRRLRIPAHRLDRAQRRLPLQPDRRDWAIRRVEGVGRTAIGRSAHPGVARRVRFRCVHRGRVGLRYSGGHLFGAPDRPRLHAALRCRVVAHRQYRASRVRCDRHADPHARRRHRHPGDDDRHHGGPATAVRLADRAGVANSDDERLARTARCVAGRSAVRRHVRDRPVCLEQLRGRRAGGHRRRPRVDRRPRVVLPRVAPARSLVRRCRGRWRGVGRGPEPGQAGGKPRAANLCRIRATGRPVSSPRLDAVAIPQHRGDRVGPARHEGRADRTRAVAVGRGPAAASNGISRLPGRDGASRSSAHQRPGVSQGSRGSGGAGAQLGVGDRHRDPAGGARQRALLARRSAAAARRRAARRSGACARRSPRS